MPRVLPAHITHTHYMSQHFFFTNSMYILIKIYYIERKNLPLCPANYNSRVENINLTHSQQINNNARRRIRKPFSRHIIINWCSTASAASALLPRTRSHADYRLSRLAPSKYTRLSVVCCAFVYVCELDAHCIRRALLLYTALWF